MPKYTIDEEWDFDFPLEEIIEDRENHVGFPELKNLSDDEIEYLKTKSDDTIFDFSGINPYFISELRDGAYQFESGHDITERICEELSDMLQDYQEVRSYA